MNEPAAAFLGVSKCRKQTALSLCWFFIKKSIAALLMEWCCLYHCSIFYVLFTRRTYKYPAAGVTHVQHAPVYGSVFLHRRLRAIASGFLLTRCSFLACMSSWRYFQFISAERILLSLTPPAAIVDRWPGPQPLFSPSSWSAVGCYGNRVSQHPTWKSTSVGLLFQHWVRGFGPCWGFQGLLEPQAEDPAILRAPLPVECALLSKNITSLHM